MQLVRLGALCNNACVFCAQAHERAKGTERPSDEGVLSAIKAAAAGTESLGFVGGEPTMHPDLATWIACARNAGIQEIVLQTNARRLAYASYARELRAAGLSAIDVSLLGSSAAMHDYHTGTPGAFAQTVRGMRHARAAAIDVVASCVLTRSNFRHAADIVRVAHAAGATAIRFRFPVLVGRALETPARIAPQASLVEPYLKLAWIQARRLQLGAFLIGAARDPRQPFVDFLADDAERCVQHQAFTPAVTIGVGAEQLQGRARPATSERRVRDRRTGAELQEILPKLFNPASGER